MLTPTPIFQPTPEYLNSHAATVVEAANGHVLAAWFGGTHEDHPDVAIWLARHDGTAWSRPLKVADEPGVPLWNPVLFRDAADTIWLFYKVAPTIPAWTACYRRSHDHGQTWTPPVPLPAGLLGPAKNKPITLSNGDILCGSSREAWRAWACWVEISTDGGQTWTAHGPITAPGFGVAAGAWDGAAHAAMLPKAHRGVIQPAVWEYAPGRLRMLMRATRAVGRVCMAASDDYGRTWSPAAPTALPHSSSGLDVARLADGRLVLACNPVPEGRTPLALFLSDDNGDSWPRRVDVETAPGEYSYPSLAAGAGGRLHLVYTWQRQHIRYLTFTAADL